MCIIINPWVIEGVLIKSYLDFNLSFFEFFEFFQFFNSKSVDIEHCFNSNTSGIVNVILNIEGSLMYI